jgi:hypothetical protein
MQEASEHIVAHAGNNMVGHLLSLLQQQMANHVVSGALLVTVRMAGAGPIRQGRSMCRFC